MEWATIECGDQAAIGTLNGGFNWFEQILELPVTALVMLGGLLAPSIPPFAHLVKRGR